MTTWVNARHEAVRLILADGSTVTVEGWRLVRTNQPVERAEVIAAPVDQVQQVHEHAEGGGV